MFGRLCLAAPTLGDLPLTATTATTGTTATGATALTVLADAPELSVTELGRRIGLSQPAAARMVASLERSLESAGLVLRQPSAGKSMALRLTPTGRQAASRALAARHDALARSLDRLDTARQKALAEPLDALLDPVYDQIGSAHRIADSATAHHV